MGIQPSVRSDHDHAEWIAGARREFERLRSLGGSSAGGPGPNTPIPDTVRRLLPGYEVLREVHRGGQGIVYEAIQRSTRRTVAVKVMREGPFAGHREVHRFDREVNILAQLNHRSIVGILDRGIAEGSHFLVMDFVDGRPLDRYVREQGLGIPDQLRLYACVCDAVSAAHQRGVIHRDLKPGNILIDAAGEPHVLDFGLAKSASDGVGDAATQTGQFVGSLPWASPEQAMGQHMEVDVRSDVYSLGVILYQLLTGHFPYLTAGGMGDVLGNIRSVEPGSLQRYSGEIDDDLSTIVLKCLRKEPARRYQSVGELARDIRHHLAHEPIEAKRDSGLYVLGKLLRRHWLATSIGAAFIAVVGLATIISLTLWQTSSRERDRARIEAEKARTVNRFLRDMLGAANPDSQSGRDVTVREILDTAVQEIDSGSLNSLPPAEAAARLTIGEAYLSLGKLDAAETQLLGARQFFEQAGAGPNAEAAEASRLLAETWLGQGRVVEAGAAANRALEMFRAVHSGDHMDIVNTLRTAGRAESLSGHRDQDLALRQEAVAIQARLLGPSNPDVLHARAIVAMTGHDVGDAEQYLREAIAGLQTTYGENHYRVAKTYRTLGGVLNMKRDFDGSEAAYQKAIGITRATCGDDHPMLVDLYAELCFVQLRRGTGDAGEAAAAAATATARRAFGETDRRYARQLFEEAGLVMRRGDAARAESMVRCVLAILESSSEIDPWTRPLAESVLGEALTAQGHLEEAEPLLLRGYEGIIQSENHQLLERPAVQRLVTFYERTGRLDEAERWRSKLPARPRHPH